jgi:hypothetical protein
MVKNDNPVVMGDGLVMDACRLGSDSQTQYNTGIKKGNPLQMGGLPLPLQGRQMDTW